VLIGNDDGTFTEEITSPIETGSVLTQIAVADFNNDNQLDLATIDFDNGEMRIFLGNGNATFRALATFSMGYESGPEKLTVCDFNGDNWLDIAVVNYGADNILVFVGNGNGNFSISATLYTGQRTHPAAIATADFNGDSFLDIVITIFKGQDIFTYLGHGNGTFEEQIVVFAGTDSDPDNIVAGDFNNDTWPDAMFWYNKMNILTLMVGYGNGTLDIRTKFVIKTADKTIPVAVSDFNCDGHQDILLGQSFNYSIGALLGHGNGNFDTQTIFSLEISDLYNQNDAITVVDFNGDGFQDIFAINKGSGVLYMLLNTCDCCSTDICKTNTFIRQ
jgi:hypothetical protein